jgi:hypothetical protein
MKGEMLPVFPGHCSCPFFPSRKGEMLPDFSGSAHALKLNIDNCKFATFELQLQFNFESCTFAILELRVLRNVRRCNVATLELQVHFNICWCNVATPFATLYRRMSPSRPTWRRAHARHLRLSSHPSPALEVPRGVGCHHLHLRCVLGPTCYGSA